MKLVYKLGQKEIRVEDLVTRYHTTYVVKGFDLKRELVFLEPYLSPKGPIFGASEKGISPKAIWLETDTEKTLRFNEEVEFLGFIKKFKEKVILISQEDLALGELYEGWGIFLEDYLVATLEDFPDGKLCLYGRDGRLISLPGRDWTGVGIIKTVAKYLNHGL